MRDPATQCASGFTWTGGSCQSIASYATAVPSGFAIVGGTISANGCPAGYTAVGVASNFPLDGSYWQVCRKN